MNAREKLNDLISSKGIKGKISLSKESLYVKFTKYLEEFNERINNQNIPVLIYNEKYNFEMKTIAGSALIHNIPVIFFSFENFIETLKKQDVDSISSIFFKRFVFGCLAHEFFHCRENGKYLGEYHNHLEHDSDPEEIQADQFAINFLSAL